MYKTDMKKGTLIEDVSKSKEIMELFTPVEGLNCVYYGKVRNGKTVTATRDILDLLKRGEVVYANWKINFDGFDERESWLIILVRFLFGKKYFFNYHKENFHFLSPDDLITNTGEYNLQYLTRLVGVHIFIDEGQWIFNSMEKLNMSDPESVAKHKLVLHGGHYCRSLNLITQRAGNIFKTMRSQVNIWYRCTKRMDVFGYIIFQRWEIEDMKDDLPVDFDKREDGKEVPLGICKTYFVNKKRSKVFQSYNTHGMREADAIEEVAKVDVYKTTWKERLAMLWAVLVPVRASTKPAKGSGQAVQSSLRDRLPLER